MYSKNVLAASGVLFTVVMAIPMAKRDIVWVTETQEHFVTIPVTATVWVNPDETATGSAASHYGHHTHGTVTSYIQPTVTVSATSSLATEASAESSAESTSVVQTPSSTYVAPTTSSTSESVAPTTTSTYLATTATSRATSTYVETTATSTYVAPTTTSESVAPTPTSAYVAPTTTSTYVAPTTSSVSVAPTPTSTYVATTTTSSAPAATSSAAGLSSGEGASGTSYTGDLTWFADGLGACGWTNGPSDHIVAVSEIIFDSYPDGGNPNNNPLCGKYVTITGVDGSEYQAEIVDRCTGCAQADLDLSEDFFNTVTDNGNGRVSGISWKFD